jgi:hypothetical protein
MFFNSQTETEQNHIISAFIFELSKVETKSVRTRMVGQLANVSSTIAQRVADGLGMVEESNRFQQKFRLELTYPLPTRSASSRRHFRVWRLKSLPVSSQTVPTRMRFCLCKKRSRRRGPRFPVAAGAVPAPWLSFRRQLCLLRV